MADPDQGVANLRQQLQAEVLIVDISGSPPRISLLRAARGFAQADLADIAGVSPATVSNIERGRRPISADLRDRLAAALDCPGEVIDGGGFAVVVTDAGAIRVEAAAA